MISQQITINGKRYSKRLKQDGTPIYKGQRMVHKQLFWFRLNPVLNHAVIERIEAELLGKS